MRLPPFTLSERVRGLLFDFYLEHDATDLADAIALLADQYRLVRPRIVWCRPQRIAGGHHWADFDSNFKPARIRAIHPRRWPKSAEEWVSVLAHELGHWIDEADCERRADRFAAAIMEAVK